MITNPILPTLIALVKQPPSVSFWGSLDEFFHPFEYFDLSRTYEQFASIIDLTIYLLIFVGLARVTLSRRFPGPGGRAISVGIGLSLAITMVVAEQPFGFNLRSFGPIAAGILFLKSHTKIRAPAPGKTILGLFLGMKDICIYSLCKYLRDLRTKNYSTQFL